MSPSTPKADTKAEDTAPDPATSSESTHATKKAVEPPDTNPPSGSAVEEERGLPSGG